MQTVRIADLPIFATARMQKVTVFETPRFFLDLYCLEPGQSQSPHAHAENDKVYLIWQGRGRVQVGAEECTLDPGEAALAPAGADHALFNDGPERLIVVTWMAPHPRAGRHPASPQ